MKLRLASVLFLCLLASSYQAGDDMAIELADGIYKSYLTRKKREAVYETADPKGNRIIVATGFSGDNSIDRDEEIVDQTKWRSESYDINLVKFMPFHEYNKFPLGKHWWIKPDPNKKDATATKFRAQFGPHEFGIAFGELYLDGIMDSFSEGFKAFKWITPNEKSAQWSRTFVDQIRLEISAVTIPANKNARIDDMEKAFDEVMLSKEETKAVIKEYLFEEDENGLWVEKDTIIKIWDDTSTSIRHRIREPESFIEGSFRTVPIKRDKPRVNSVMGKLKNGSGSMVIQSVIFPKEDDWTMEKAKAWYKDHPDLGKDYSDLEVKVMELESEIEELKSKHYTGYYEQETASEENPIEIDTPEEVDLDGDLDIDLEPIEVEL